MDEAIAGKLLLSRTFVFLEPSTLLLFSVLREEEYRCVSSSLGQEDGGPEHTVQRSSSSFSGASSRSLDTVRVASQSIAANVSRAVTVLDLGEANQVMEVFNQIASNG